uniref:NAC domain-containing protein n=1 Tax=Leersia perrieri TaxID=77586 RepID=A0A0D9W128_9ORYZ
MGADDETAPDRPGLVFRPSDDKLITLYLRPKITNTPFKNNLINNADVYSSDPADLVANHNPAPGTQDSSSVWFFFCSPRYTSKRVSSGRRQRAIGAGAESTWKSEGGKKAVNGADGRPVGYLQKFSYGVYDSSTSSKRAFTRLGWCMTEYSLDDDDDVTTNNGSTEKLVLCKVYRSPRAATTKRKADEAGVDDHTEDAPPSVRPRQEAAAGSEQDKQSSCLLPPGFDLDAFLESLWMDHNMGNNNVFSNATVEQLPCAPAMDLVGGDGDFFQTASGPCMDAEVMERLAAGETVDDILGMSPLIAGNGDGGGDFFQTASGPCMDTEVMERLAAGETVDDILGMSSLIGQQEVLCF